MILVGNFVLYKNEHRANLATMHRLGVASEKLKNVPFFGVFFQDGGKRRGVGMTKT